MREVANRTAIITGGSRGLGPHVARALAGAGMKLILAARSREELEGVAAGLRDGGAEAIAVPTDVTEHEALEALAAEAHARFGAIDVLVNNAGAVTAFPYEGLSGADIERVVGLNLTSAMVLARLVLPGMLERGRGHIVNMSSLAGLFGAPYDGVYGATKAGLIGFSQSLRAEFRQRGVSASVICPGYVRQAGIYAEASRFTGVSAPWLVGTTSPEAVARAVVKAIRRDLPLVNVSPSPVRPLAALARISPGFTEWFLHRIDGWAPFVAGARANEKLGGSLTGVGHGVVDQ
ncbi:MAG TPA: SDR family NAD(P)-dependent oxidoreductase [Gemmatimonadota bacterium]|nr:SDR family NAD(P)-dependent oxidoreductase [Gemmatimonadota bacterium]